MTEKDQKILDEIRTEFLALADQKRKGFHITLEMAYSWLGISLTEEIKRQLLFRHLRATDSMFIEAKSEEDRGHFIIKKEGKRNIIWFSDEGFKALCLTIKSPKSKYILEHFIQLEYDYLRVLEQSEEANRKELNEIKEKIKNYNSKLLRMEKDRDVYMMQSQHYVKEYTRLKRYEHVIDGNFYNEINSQEYLVYMFLKEKYMNPTPLYVVESDHVLGRALTLKKKKDEMEDDNEIKFDDDESIPNGYEYYEFAYLNQMDLEDELNNDMEFYFHIPGFKSKAKADGENFRQVATINLYDRTHLSELRAALIQNGMHTRIKHVYRMTYSYLTELINSCLANRLSVKNE